MEQTALEPILTLAVPLQKKRKRTTFDISGTSRKEVIISRWYAYFLRKEEDHQLSSLFLGALLECLPAHVRNRFGMSEYTVLLEVGTKSGNRIDVLLEGKGEDKGKYILLENKVDHWLHNDLQDYWMHAATEERNKVGVLLTLSKEDIPSSVEGKFFNVLHKDWIKAVKANLPAGLSLEDSFAINDFIAAITNLNADIEMNDQVQLFLENAKRINALLQTKQATYQYIVNNLQAVAERKGYRMEKSADQRLVYFYLPKVQNVSHVVKFEQLFKTDLKGEPHLEISTVLTGKARSRVLELDAIFPDRIPAGMLHRAHEGTTWCHYLMRRSPITMELMKSVQAHVLSELQILEPLTKEMIAYLSQKQPAL